MVIHPVFNVNKKSPVTEIPLAAYDPVYSI